jgi:hypothetical protein
MCLLEPLYLSEQTEDVFQGIIGLPTDQSLISSYSKSLHDHPMNWIENKPSSSTIRLALFFLHAAVNVFFC